jgi:hypothetical protein
LDVPVSQMRTTETQRPERALLQTQGEDTGLPPSSSHHPQGLDDLSVWPSFLSPVCEPLRKWTSSPRGGGATQHSQAQPYPTGSGGLGTQTKVLASNCCLSKAQPASSATGVRGKLMSLSQGRGGWHFRRLGSLCYLGEQAHLSGQMATVTSFFPACFQPSAELSSGVSRTQPSLC